MDGIVFVFINSIMNKFFIIIYSVLLVSCCASKTPAGVTTPKYIIRSEISDVKSIQIHSSHIQEVAETEDNNWLSYVDDIDDFIIAYPADTPKKKPVFMSDMSMEKAESGSTCTAALTGASELVQLDNSAEKIQWGRVDFFEKYGGDGWIDYDGPRPLCAQPAEAVQRYALCSEKGGKTVVICIYQMKDNPELAKKVFETFRWTK
jgi:hypothetical protein